MTATKDQAIWGIHAGRTGEAHTLFLKHNVVALGWVQMGNLAALPADREAFKARVQAVYPEYKPGAVPVQAGQLYRFVHELQVGDLAVCRSEIQ